MTYFLDSNVLIHSKNYEFSFDETPDFWELILKLGQQNQVVIVEEVYDEIIKGKDDLSKWIKEYKKDLVNETTSEVYASLKDVLQVYLYGSETDEESCLETIGADPWVIAHALACGGTVISLEKERISKQQGQTLPKPCNRKIPMICRELNVQQMSLAKFLWKHRKII